MTATLTWALLPVLLAASALPSNTAAATPPDQSCFDCPWLDLPLDEWSAERNETVSETLPWGQVVTFDPIDYRQLAVQLCDCVLDSLEGAYGSHQPPNHFVQANGTQFWLQGEPFRFAGFNAQQALTWAASGDGRFLGDLQALFADAATLGLRVGRVWANANGVKVRPPFLDRFDDLVPQLPEPPWLTLQPAPGVLNETALRALDHVLKLAEDHGIRLILNLADYHARFGSSPAGIEPYLQWVAGSLNFTGYTVLDFYRDERVKLLFRLNLCQLANRASSLTGIKYKDIPAIFAWDLINEPRCPACPPGRTRSSVLVDWADEMSAFMSCVDPNHMVSVATEGYFGETTPQYLTANPGSWVLCAGASVTELSSLPHISFGVAHMYESMRGNWDEANRSECGWDCVKLWFEAWMQAQFNASLEVTRKPFVLEESGIPWVESRRNEVFKMVQEAFQTAWSQNTSSSAAGSMFWGATAGDQADWDGWQVRLDGGTTVPAPTAAAAALKKEMPPEQQRWLDEVDAMQASFRHAVLEKLCQEAVKDQYATMFGGYSSGSTLEILRAMATDAANSEAVTDGGRG